MMLQLRSSFLLICLTVCFYSCQKEYSLEGNQTAVLTFPGAPGACTNAVVTGIYQSGLALDATNLVTISVDVTKIGSYTISTAISNGISFSGTGSFTTTGTQTITLNGSGIPVSTGTFSFAPGAGGCSFSVTVTGGGSPGTQAVYTLNGAPNNCTGFTTAGTYTAGTALGAGNTVGVGVNVTTVGTYTITSNTVNGSTFSATGTFTTTGSQVVQLTGSGTPTVAGAFNYLISGTGGCGFSITVVPGVVVVTDFFRCTIDGVAKTFNINAYGVKVSADTLELGGEETAGSKPPTFLIQLGKTPTITTGAYSRLQATNRSTYCLAFYDDGVTAGTTWLSGLTPTAAAFSVTVTLVNATRIEGTFSGTIYSDPLTDAGPRVITAGQFSLPIL